MSLPKWRFAKLLTLIVVFITYNQPVFASPIELSLDDCILLALKNNSNVKLANYNLHKMEWGVKQAEANKGFNLSYAHNAQRYDTPPTSIARFLHTKYPSEIDDGYSWTTKFDNSLTLTLPIYTGGKLESQIEQANLNLTVSTLNLDAIKQQIKQSVTNYYFSALQNRNNLQISQETVNNYASHLKNVQIQYEVGTVAQFDVLSSEVSLANAQNGLIKAKNSYELVVANLNNAIGLPLESELKIKDDLRYEKYALSLDDYVKYALANRPEITEYQAKINIAKNDIKISKSDYLPVVNFVAKEDWYDNELPGAENNNWLVGISVSMNIFDSGLSKSKVKQSEFNLDTALEQARQQRDTILLEVRQYYLSMCEAENRIDTSMVAVKKAQDSLRISEVRYNAGVGTNLDVLDAVLALNQSRTNYIQALYDYNNNKAQLDKAIGVAVK